MPAARSGGPAFALCLGYQDKFKCDVYMQVDAHIVNEQFPLVDGKMSLNSRGTPVCMTV
uniref:Uncharacterized protein n=1 Tax=Setaria italica TaxID=4555 RepID=K3YFN0_SETIT